MEVLSGFSIFRHICAPGSFYNGCVAYRQVMKVSNSRDRVTDRYGSF